MKRSTDRILTTHAGRLNDQRRTQGLSPEDEMREIVKRQLDLGIDIISDGEVNKVGGMGFGYYGKRMAGLSVRQTRPGEPLMMSQKTQDREDFAEFYKEQMQNFAPPQGGGDKTVISGPLSYIGQDLVKSDIEMFNQTLKELGGQPEETFMCVLAPGWLEHSIWNDYYKTDEEYLFALADAIAPEYRAIVDAGFILQLDDPGLPDTYDMIVPHPTIEEYRKFAEIRIDAQNHALKGIDPSRVRYHICWGSWHGPHVHDLELKYVIDLMLKVDAQAYSVEAANPRHEHEWKLWKDVKLPEGKILIPGVVSHASNVVEHPELVADRIKQYASCVGKENVIAGTDCGMGGRIHMQIGWAKLKALVEGAEMASKELWGR